MGDNRLTGEIPDLSNNTNVSPSKGVAGTCMYVLVCVMWEHHTLAHEAALMRHLQLVNMFLGNDELEGNTLEGTIPQARRRPSASSVLVAVP